MAYHVAQPLLGLSEHEMKKKKYRKFVTIIKLTNITIIKFQIHHQFFFFEQS